MASLMILVLAVLGLFTASTTVHGATTTPKAQTLDTVSLALDANRTTSDSLPTSNLTAASRKSLRLKTPAATSVGTSTIAVTTATTAPLRLLRRNRTRLTRASSSTTSLPISSLEVGSSSSVNKEPHVPLQPSGKNGKLRDQRQRYDRPEYTETRSGVPDLPKYYSHSRRMSYSSSTGSGPRFSSSEEYFHLPLDEVLGSESEINSNVESGGERLQPASKRSSSGESRAGNRQDCRMMHKPMPDYLEYTGKNSGQGLEKPMMTCYVCGKKDAPFSNGGYTEDCDVSPTNQKDVYVNPDGSHQEDYDNPKGRATKSHGKLYAGDGQSPYLTGAGNGGAASGRSGGRYQGDVQDGHVPSYGSDDGEAYYGGEEGSDGHGSAYPQATDSSGAVYDGNDGSYGGGNGGASGGYDDGAETDKSSCKVVYKGKMKCRVCGDPKEGGAFDEQCDYEKDAPEQHHSRAYDHSSNNEKRYRSKPHRGSGSRGGGGRGHGHGDDYGGYGDDYHGSYNYPRYDNYGAGTGFDPDYGNTAPSYDYGGGSGGGGYRRRNGKSQSKEQPEASTTISDKKDVGGDDANNAKKRDCKVTYKEVTSSYSPYDTKKKKPKMKCLVCNGAEGVTEECSYNGAGELSASFPGPSDVSSFFSRDSGDRSFYSPTERDGFQDFFF